MALFIFNYLKAALKRHAKNSPGSPGID